MLPEQKVNFGLGPSTVVVMCEAMGSVLISSKGTFKSNILTEEDARVKILSNRWCVLLQIASIVVEWAILSPVTEHHGVVHHFLVEVIKHLMVDGILDDDETVLVQVTHGQLKVPFGQSTLSYFVGTCLDRTYFRFLCSHVTEWHHPRIIVSVSVSVDEAGRSIDQSADAFP